MIDSHCHLNFENIKDNFDKVVQRAIKNNITSILSINTDPDEFDSHYELIQKYKSIFISFGLHPENVKKNKSISIDKILSESKKDLVIALGETGLDFYHSNDFKKEQYLSFENHIECSIINNLPLIIHQRNSENEIMDVLKSYQKKNKLKVVFHCFTGSEKLKKFCIDNEFYISLSGIITFKNANNLRDVIQLVPLKYLLIETDSPFLAPVPLRGKSNEPANVRYVADYLSNYLNISLNEFINITDNNFYNLFSKAKRYNKISK